MKKWWIIPIAALFLAACGNDDEAQQPKDEEISVDLIEPEEQPAEPAASEDQVAPADSEMTLEEENSEDQPVSSDFDLSAYEESAVLADHMPVDELTPHVETDNPGKRIMLFEDASGQKVYKSIFIKHDQHLKIIDLKSDNLLYEGQL